MTRLPRPAEHVRRDTRPAGDQGIEPGLGSGHHQGEPGYSADAVGSVESLYPFLYEGTFDSDQVIAQARQSTEAKAREIIDLRAEVCSKNGELLGSCASDMADRFVAGGRLLTFGNGGSATDAQEIAGLFMYPADAAESLPAIGLASDVSVLTSLANDIGVEVIFSRQIAAFGRKDDIALGLSTSGNSENLLQAFDHAHKIGMMTVGISGYDGGKMAEIGSLDYLFIAPSASIHRIQEAQTTVYHILWELVVAELAARPAIT